MTMKDKLLRIHGPGNCHICGKPMAGQGSTTCSYPHGMIPVEQVTPGMWSWGPPDTGQSPVDKEEGK